MQFSVVKVVGAFFIGLRLFLSSVEAVDNNSHLHHFAYYGTEREGLRSDIRKGVLDKTPALEGVQLRYLWSDLEPKKGQYSFKKIEEDLRLLERHNKKLWIQLQDSTFAWEGRPPKVPVPKYIASSAKYDGGYINVKEQNKETGKREITFAVALRFNLQVQERFQRLMQKLGEEFDGRIAGINLPEPASCPRGIKHFTPKRYFESMKSNMQCLSYSFPKSVKLQYVNFMPGEWLPDNNHGYLKGIFKYGQDINVGIGAPDLLPTRLAQQQHVLKYMKWKRLRGPARGIAVQEGNYTGETGHKSTVKEVRKDPVTGLERYAREKLDVNYIFWCTEEPFYSRYVIPFLSDK
jgi:hypothetical protein